MDYFLGLPLPAHYAARTAAFRRAIAARALRPQRSEPHLSVKGSAGLDDGPATLAAIAGIAGRTAPFDIQLGPPALFAGEPVLYLDVESPGWSRLNRALIDLIAARTGATLHPLEISGWVPHVTVIRLKPELAPRHPAILAATAAALSPFPAFTADTLRLYRRARDGEPWLPLRDFALAGRQRENA